MARKLITLVSILAILNLTTGCGIHVRETVLLSDPYFNPDAKIVEVILLSGETIHFNESGGLYEAEKEIIIGFDADNKQQEIDARDVLYVRVEKVSAGAVFGIVILTLVGGLALAVSAVIVSSCPLVYSFDGLRYVFDAEPLGGSISAGLAKTDWSRLEYLREHDGYYELLVRNEFAETQHLDEMRLLVAEHPAGTTVYPDLSGNLHAVGTPIAPVSATDESGRDLRPFVAHQDFGAWQSRLPKDSSFRGGDPRHHLTFSFPRPKDAQSASLLVNAGTATWGSNMIRSMLALRGDKVDDWYADIDAGGIEKLKLGAFILREELFVLKVQVKEGGAWVHRGYIAGSGPYMTEDRVCTLDLSHVTGDLLEIRLDPPVGYWVIDHLAVSYDAPAGVQSRLVAAESMRDQDGREIAALLASNDGTSHHMPVTGQYFTARFPAPPAVPGMERSIFLQTSGWYELHLAKDTPEQTDLIRKLMGTPGAIVSYGLEEYLKSRTRHVAAQN